MNKLLFNILLLTDTQYYPQYNNLIKYILNGETLIFTL